MKRRVFEFQGIHRVVEASLLFLVQRPVLEPLVIHLGQDGRRTILDILDWRFLGEQDNRNLLLYKPYRQVDQQPGLHRPRIAVEPKVVASTRPAGHRGEPGPGEGVPEEALRVLVPLVPLGDLAPALRDVDLVALSVICDGEFRYRALGVRQRILRVRPALDPNVLGNQREFRVQPFFVEAIYEDGDLVVALLGLELLELLPQQLDRGYLTRRDVLLINPPINLGVDRLDENLARKPIFLDRGHVPGLAEFRDERALDIHVRLLKIGIPILPPCGEQPSRVRKKAE